MKQSKSYASLQEWQSEGYRIFGQNVDDWAFVCPVCKHVMTVRDYKKAGAPVEAFGYSCIGRYLDECRDAFELSGREGSPLPCNYAGRGLFKLNPVKIEGMPDRAFEFADPDEVKKHE